jgi:hypothetical protein
LILIADTSESTPISPFKVIKAVKSPVAIDELLEEDSTKNNRTVIE